MPDPRCSRCGKTVGSYGWNEKGEVVCITCENNERISKDYIKKGFPKFKDLKVGDLVVDKDFPEHGVATIFSIDVVNTLFGSWRHFLLDYPPESKGYPAHWALENDIEKVETEKPC